MTQIAISILYWALILIIFIGLSYADPGWSEGGIPLLVITLPWSILVLLLAGIISLIPGVEHVITTEAANFFMSFIVFGGLNIVLILGAQKVLRLLRSSLRLRIFLFGIATILVAAAQLAMPGIDRDALERTKLRNIPKDAVHVGGAQHEALTIVGFGIEED